MSLLSGSTLSVSLLAGSTLPMLLLSGSTLPITVTVTVMLCTTSNMKCFNTAEIAAGVGRENDVEMTSVGVTQALHACVADRGEGENVLKMNGRLSWAPGTRGRLAVLTTGYAISKPTLPML